MKIKINSDLSIDGLYEDDYPQQDGEVWQSVNKEQAERCISIDYNTQLWQFKNNDVVESEFKQQILDGIFNAKQAQLRTSAYPVISDPVFFQYQRGQKTEQDWKDAVQRVKDMYPYRGQ